MNGGGIDWLLATWRLVCLRGVRFAVFADWSCGCAWGFDRYAQIILGGANRYSLSLCLCLY